MKTARQYFTMVLSMICLLPTFSFAADTAKLKHQTTIYADEKGGELKKPEGVACNGSALIIADSGNGRLVRFTLEGETIKGGTELRPSQLSNPVKVQLSPKGDIFTLDAKSRRIVNISNTGAFQGYLDPQGVPAPGVIASAFKIDGEGNFYLLDIFGARVLVLDQKGKFTRQVPFPAGYGFMIDVAVDEKGTVYVVDSTNSTLSVATRDAKEFAPLVKNLREYLSFPGYLTTDARRLIHVVDQNGGGVVTFGQDGAFLARQLAMGRKNGLLYYPGQICITPSGGVFIADTDNSRVQLFEPVK